MDADGEDRPEEISDLILKAKELQNVSSSQKSKRSEGPIFTFFSYIALTLIFTNEFWAL